jgi:hypothetical protein
MHRDIEPKSFPIPKPIFGCGVYDGNGPYEKKKDLEDTIVGVVHEEKYTM